MDRSNQREPLSHDRQRAGVDGGAAKTSQPSDRSVSGSTATDRTVALVAIGLGTLVVPFDTSVNIAFPLITDTFSVPIEAIQWVVICYVLAHSSLMLVFGKLGDLFGHRWVFQIGLGCSALAFTLCAGAPGFGWLLLARVLQGIGAALIISCGLALTTSCFSEARRAKALGLYTAIFGLGMVLGPSLGGAMVAEWGWAAVFWSRVPVSLLALVLTLAIPSLQRPADSRPFDHWGGALLAGALACMLLTVNQLQRPEATWPVTLALASLAVAASFGFVIRELRAAEPIIRPSVFLRLDFALLNLINVMVNLVGFSMMLLVPFYLSRATDHSAMVSGLILAAAPFGMVLAGPAGGWSIGHFRPDRIASAAIMLIVAGLALVGMWDGATTVAFMIFSSFIQGAGMGLFQVCYSHIVTGMLAPRDRGVSGSVAMVTRSAGIMIGATVLTWMFVGALGASGAFLLAFQATFRNAALLLSPFLALTVLWPRLCLGASEFKHTS